MSRREKFPICLTIVPLPFTKDASPREARNSRVNMGVSLLYSFARWWIELSLSHGVSLL